MTPNVYVIIPALNEEESICKVLGDIDVIKGDGFWGEKIATRKKKSA